MNGLAGVVAGCAGVGSRAAATGETQIGKRFVRLPAGTALNSLGGDHGRSHTSHGGV